MKKDFSRYFEDEKVYRLGERFEIIRLYSAGDIKLKSGNIIAGDPYSSGVKPLKKKAEIGSFPIKIIVKHYDVASDVIAAMIQFSNMKPVKWESALGYESEDRPFGIPIDSATACFIDNEDYQKIQSKLSEGGWNANYYEKIQKLMENSMKENYNIFANFILDDIGVNLLVFPSGFGDGSYPCYWGYDENNVPACLLIDFLTIKLEMFRPWPEPNELPPIPKKNEEFFNWLEIVQEKNDDILIIKKPLENEFIKFLKSTVKVEIPLDILEYYKYCTPWEVLDNPKESWQKIFKHLKEKFGFEALPINISSMESYTIAKLIAPNKYQIWDMYKDGFYLCANDIRTFFLNSIITRYY